MATMSIGRTFGWWAERDPDGIAVHAGDEAITRRELEVRANRLARAYQDLGVGVDDLVTVGLPNGIEFYVACAAIWKAGATPQPVSPRLPVDERQAIVELGDPALLVGVDADEHPGRTCLPVGFEPSAGLADTALDDVRASSWKAPVSGGSTGRPKIIYSGTPASVDPQRPTASYIPAEAVQLVPGPLHHSAPFLFSMRGLFMGHTLVVLPRFDAEAALRAVETHRVTWTLLAPTMMQRIWRLGDDTRTRYDVSSLEAILHVGAPCPQWLKRAWIDWLGPQRVWEIYAGTESAGVAVIGGHDWLAHPGSVGRPAPGFEFCVLDDAGQPVPPGTVGEIYMRPRGGAGSTYRYVGAQARRTDEGWDSIGDLGRVDDEGFYYLSDRVADVIVADGQQLYPAELEAVLDAHESVRSSAVIGLPGDGGDRIHAIVDTAGADVGAAALLEWVGREWPEWTLPLTVEIVGEPLRDDAGKVRRGGLRAERSR